MKIFFNNSQKVKIGDSIEVYYKGVFIYKFLEVGITSVNAFLKDFFSSTVDFSDVYGCFWMFINKRDESKSYFFCDNSGIMPFYVYREESLGVLLSDSLISLVREGNFKKTDIHWNGVISFLEFGFVLSGETFFSSIKRCLKNKIGIVTGDNEKIQYIDKNYTRLENGSISFDDKIFESKIKKLLSAFGEETLLFDCSGGVDSRLLVVLANSLDIPYELFVRGQKNCGDIQIATQIASIVNKKLNILNAKPVEDFSFDYLRSVWEQLDGFYPIFEGKQLLDAGKYKYKLNTKYSFSGVAGDFYFRDYYLLRNGLKHHCMIDIVSLHRSKVSIINNNLYEKYLSFLHEKFANYFVTDRMEGEFLFASEQFLPYSTGRQFGFVSNYVYLYGPFLEHSFVRVCKKGTIFQKWFDKAFRLIISRNNKRLSKLKTLYGMTLSDDILDIAKDVCIFLLIFAKRIYCKVVKKRMYKPTSFVVSASCNFEEFKKSSIYQEMKSKLLENGLLKNDTSVESLSDKFLDRLLVIYFWLLFLENQD